MVCREKSYRAGHREAAFTLIELLVVLAIIAILASLLLPVLARGKARALTASCLSNFKQLDVCWLMYSGDFHDRLVNNFTRDNAACGTLAWIRSGAAPGVAWTGNAQLDPTNLAITTGVLFPYNSSAAIYHCPADRSTVVGSPGLLRSRSVSMSIGVNWMNEGDPVPTNLVARAADLVNPRPSLASVFVDEQENSIDNNALGIYPRNGGDFGYWNVPASRHNNGCVLAFADGHAEDWHWRGPYIAKAAQYSNSQPDDPDIRRLMTTVPPDPYSP